MPASDIIQIVFGILSFLGTIIVSFAIYFLQARHEKEVAKIESNYRQKELEEKANKFILDNKDDIGYLPWCTISASIHKHQNHNRKIYSNFNYLSTDLQNEILKQADYPTLHTISNDDDWVSVCLDKLQKDIEAYKLGRNVLYDGAKYFHRSFKFVKMKNYQI